MGLVGGIRGRERRKNMFSVGRACTASDVIIRGIDGGASGMFGLVWVVMWIRKYLSSQSK